MIADFIVADYHYYLFHELRRYIADGIIAGLFLPFVVDSGPDEHSEVLLLFIGCFVNFSVSYLICMLQDSVPAGSYNDPFLSSVTSMVAPTSAMDPFEGTSFAGLMLTELTLEFTHFNLVIRLSKVQQFAFRLCTTLRCPAAPAVLEIPVTGSFK